MALVTALPPPTLPALPPALLDEPLARWSAHPALAGEPPFRARQLAEWVFRHQVTDFGAMDNLPKALRARLAAKARVAPLAPVETRRSADGSTKWALQADDGALVETVLIPTPDRTTLCVSTQVGCAMGCVFCASGLAGWERHLRAGEIVGQVAVANAALAAFRGTGGGRRGTGIPDPRPLIPDPSERPRPRRIDHLVVMGMGEPLANLENLLAALAIITAPEGVGLGQRRVTVSTVGLPDRIRALAASDFRGNLALSLHAPDEELRRRLIPSAGRVPLADVLAATQEYFRATGREVTFEYVLLAGCNDADEQARALAALLADRRGRVNLIPYNPVPGLDFQRPSPARVARFAALLHAAGVRATVRTSRGDDVAAACGQLRRARAPGAAGEAQPETGQRSVPGPVSFDRV